jgi:WD40 repeat protein/serine/threonine protein kinase
VNDSGWDRVKQLVHETLLLPVEEHARFIAAHCGEDPDIRSEVESLVAVGLRMDSGFLSQAPLETAADATIAAGYLFEDRYRLMSRLGQGGMGQVWLAEQVEPVRRQVALKLIRAGMYDEATVLRFRAERQSLAIMDHPCIAKVLEAGTSRQGQPYFVMEYVAGPPITEYCDQHRLSIRQRLALFMLACEGVQHAHQKAVLHRDLKPANILIAELDGRPVPRIIDFGLARATVNNPVDSTLTLRLGELLGTPGFVSPEQVDPSIRDIDTRCDVYALGVILYVLLTGVRPFRTDPRQGIDEWLRQLRTEDPPRPSDQLAADAGHATLAAACRGTGPKALRAALRGDLDAIALKALERDRDHRYATPAHLAADLQRYLDDEVVSARATSRRTQLRKFIRRNRAIAVGGATTLCLALLAIGAGVVAMRNAAESRHQAGQTLLSQSRLMTQAAAQFLRDGDVATARSIILEVFTNPDFTAGRNAWAAGVLQGVRAADAQLAILGGHGSWVYSAVFSPDGMRIVTASADGTARIWDARTGLQLLTLSGHQGSVFSAAFSPEGSRIVTASADRTLRIWNAASGALLKVLTGHTAGVFTAAWSADGARIVSASRDRTARIWNAHDGAVLRVLAGHGDVVSAAAFSPDGTRVATASFDRTARIWDARSGRALRVLAGHGDEVHSVEFAADGRRLVTASFDHTARIWNAATGAQELVLGGHQDSVYSAAFSSDGARVVTGSRDNTARVWDAATGAPLASFQLLGDAHVGVSFSPDGARIATAAGDRTVRVWRVAPPAQLQQLDVPGWVMDARYSPDGRHIVTASTDRYARIWDAASGALLGRLAGHASMVYAAAYSPDGSRLATASSDSTARIWDAGSGVQLQVLAGHGARVNAVSFSPTGNAVATASGDGTVRVWDVASGKSLRVLTGHTDLVWDVAFSGDGTRIVSASADGTARIWDAATGTPVLVLRVPGGSMNSAAFSPDGTRIVTGSDDSSARLWDARTGRELLALTGHGSYVGTVRFSGDGQRVITTSNDRTARIWDAVSGMPLAEFRGHRGAVQTALLSPDGQKLLTASVDGTARVWDARVPASLATTVWLEAAAEITPLSQVTRSRFGLPPGIHSRRWTAVPTNCDLAAASYDDPDRQGPGIAAENIAPGLALPACQAAVNAAPQAACEVYELGRVLAASGDSAAAQARFEQAAGMHYRAASVDLADLLLRQGSSADVVRARHLYEQAWAAGVPIAAFRLAELHERAGGDPALSLQWYQRGAASGEPNALACLALRAERQALSAASEATRHGLLLEAFTSYAEAARRAQDEGWPQERWQLWRYRLATLARLLSDEGLTEAVAERYRAAAGGN